MANWLNTFFATFDFTILEFFHNIMEKYGNVLTPICKVLDAFGEIPFLLVFWVPVILFFIVKDKKCSMMMVGSVIIGVILTNLILKNLIYRARPYMSDIEVYKTWWQMVGGTTNWDTSFPSGHSCASMACALGYFIWANKKRWTNYLIFLYPIIMGMSRLCLVVHYPSDVIAGYIVGIISAFLCIPCVKLFFIIFNKYPDFPLSRFCLTGKWKKEELNN